MTAAHAQVGYAVIDPLDDAHLSLRQWVDSASWSLLLCSLERDCPGTILVCSSGNLFKSSMVQMLERLWGTRAMIRALPRSAFDDTRGAAAIRTAACERDKEAGLWESYYLAQGAAGALIGYLGEARSASILPGSLRVSYTASSSCCFIDKATCAQLELVAPLPSCSTGGGGASAASSGASCLLSLFPGVRSKGGARLLKANLVQPTRDLPTIAARLDTVGELLEQEDLRLGLSSVLAQFPKDLGRIICQFGIQGVKARKETDRIAAAIRSVLELRQALTVVKELSAALAPAQSSILRGVAEGVCQAVAVGRLQARICAVVDDDVCNGAKEAFAKKSRQIFAVKSGLDAELDSSRDAYCELTETIHRLGDELSTATGLAVKMTYAARRGFFVALPAAEYDAAPAEVQAAFMQVKRKGKAVDATIMELISLNARLEEAAGECLMCEDALLAQLTALVGSHVPTLTLLSESVALLEMLCGFANMAADAAAAGRPFCRPEMTECGPLAAEGAWHPVLESHARAAAKASGGNCRRVVPNNVFLSDAASLVIVTGANASGKSTYLKNVAVLTVLAHAGCYVPATWASLRTVDRIFARIAGAGGGAGAAGSSTFACEMKDAAYVLLNAGPRSLVCIDELGRATSSSEGFALAWAVCEALLARRCMTLFASHFERLHQLAEHYPSASVAHFRTQCDRDRLSFTYELADGALPDAFHFGLLCAASAGFPAPLVAEAERVVQVLEARWLAEAQRQAAPSHAGRSAAERRELRTCYAVGQRALSLLPRAACATGAGGGGSDADGAALADALVDLASRASSEFGRTASAASGGP